MSRFKLEVSVSWLDDHLIETTMRVNEVYDLLGLKGTLRYLTDNLDNLTKEEGWPGED